MDTTHGTTYGENFVKKDKKVLIIDFQQALFNEKATVMEKTENLRRICDIRWDNCRRVPLVQNDEWVPDDCEEDWPGDPDVFKLFGDLKDVDGGIGDDESDTDSDSENERDVYPSRPRNWSILGR
ncbi:hypothetical protein F5Y18DRAFT_428549 [Xylariaceae sp. FL1019]|nr:hypothetical protein F5Y18DRAFT_428549 [Xylariaceae sp. FL1019]